MKELTKGNPTKLLLLFSLPILLGNILQQFYNLGDTIIVGRTLGISELAAVGSTTAIVSLLFSMINGFCIGFSILTANAFGAKDENRIKETIAKSIVLMFLITITMTVLGLIFIRPLLTVLHTPADIMEDSIAYIQVIFLGLIVTAAYNLISNMLRALGDSVFPLIALAISSTLNLGLDLFCIKRLGLGIRGASIATVIAQLISVIVCLVYVIRKIPYMHIRPEHFKWNGKTVTDLLTSGAGMALMYSIVDIGSIILQSGINSLGTEIIAAHTAARKIFSFSILPISTLAASLVTFTSQNTGAGKPERVRAGIKSATILGFVWSLVAFFLLYFGGAALVRMITDSDTFVIGTAVKYLRINVPFYAFLCILCFFRSTLQGLGQKIIPVIASIIELSGKAIIVFVLVPRMGYLAVCICEPILWILSGILVSVPMYRFLKITHSPDSAQMCQ